MSNTNSIFNSEPVKVPNKSGFDCSHEVLGTLPCGTLVPYLCDELLPNTSVSLGMLSNIELPPFATEFQGKIDLEAQAFFVPSRLLWGGYKSFFARQNQNDPDGSYPDHVPTFNVPTMRKKGSSTDLCDALGLSTRMGDTESTAVRKFSVLGACAYHKVWEDWYRDARLQKKAFGGTSVADGSTTTNGNISGLPLFDGSIDFIGGATRASKDIKMFDGTSLFSLRQRNYAKDYYTTAQVAQSLGENLRVKVDVANYSGTANNVISVDANTKYLYSQNQASTTLGKVGFTIAQLREVNALQNFMDTLAATGNRYEDVMQGLYGCRPADEVLNKAVLLGSKKVGVYSKGVTASLNTTDASSVNTKNPYSNFAGSSSSVPMATSSDSLVPNFHTKEAGYLVVVLSLVPHAYYGSSYDRKFRHISNNDFGYAALAGIGNQPIFQSELVPTINPDVNDGIFGWTDRFAEYKFKNDRVFSSFCTGDTLSAFSLKREFSGVPTIGTDFIEIPQDALDEVLAYVDEDRTNYNEARVDCYFQYKIVTPLPVYSIPTLANMPDSHTEMVARGGTRL